MVAGVAPSRCRYSLAAAIIVMRVTKVKAEGTLLYQNFAEPGYPHQICGRASLFVTRGYFVAAGERQDSIGRAQYR
jgi:hypothetical protein